jgi:hypothetical protein
MNNAEHRGVTKRYKILTIGVRDKDIFMSIIKERVNPGVNVLIEP